MDSDRILARDPDPDRPPNFLSLCARTAGSWNSFLHFCIYIRHTRPDPTTKRISAVPPSKWRDVSHIYVYRDLPLLLTLIALKFTLSSGLPIVHRPICHIPRLVPYLGLRRAGDDSPALNFAK